MTRFTSFVMLAGMRTGSNLLEERLNALEGLRCHGEAFNPAFLGVPEAEVLLGIDRATREAQPEALLDALRAARGLNGFRLFEGHDARVMDAVLDDPLCAKIVLTRDPLDSYLSLAIARRTGQWKLTGPKGAKAATVPFEAEAFAAHLAGVEAHLAMIRRRLQTTGQAAFWIDYTELSDAEVLAGLARFLGVPPAVPAATTLKPQNPSPAREKVANPEEMEAALRRYGRFDPGASPDLEARRGAMVPRLVAGVEAPLLYLPIGSGPDAEVLRWLAALDGRPVEALHVNLTPFCDYMRVEPGKGGAKALKLVDVELTTDWQVGTASPSFGSRELSYLPFPGEMVRERTNMSLIYVSMDEKETLDLRNFLAQKKKDIEA